MRHNRIQITEIIRILNNNVIKIEGPVENVYIDNISDVKHTTETTLDWVNPNKLDKQIIVEKTFAKVVLVDTSVAYSDELKNQYDNLLNELRESYRNKERVMIPNDIHQLNEYLRDYIGQIVMS